MVADRKPGTPSAAAPVDIEALMRAAEAAASAGDYDTALAAWGPCAHSGNARAQAEIGRCFVEALGVERNPELAHTWLKLSADAKDPYGMRLLGDYYFNGEGGTPDRVIAEEWYARAAAKDEPLAQEMLSWIYAEGETRAPDFALARDWALKAAAQGIAKSMTRIGFLHHNAMGVARDPVQAAAWWRKGAFGGDADGQAMYGAALHLGAGVARDRVRAYAWLTRAKAGGSAFADRFLPAAIAALSPAERCSGDSVAARPLSDALLIEEGGA